MIATFPRMGTMHHVLKTLFQQLGAEVVVPPPVSKKTLELGTKYSPETICVPFKVTLGSMMEALESGADTIVTCGGVGPCRLGYYAQVQKIILQNMGYTFQMIAIEPNIMDAYKALRLVARGKTWREIYHAFRAASAKMTWIDALEKEVYRIRPREKMRGQTDRCWQSVLDAMEKANDYQEICATGQSCRAQLLQIEIRPEIKPLRIGVVGEIFVVLENFINQDLIRRLGGMGAEVVKTISLSEYVQSHLLKNRQACCVRHELEKRAKPYLRQYVGGHGMRNIGSAIQMSEEGLDGIVHLFPFTCMPEIIAKNILPRVSSDYHIPILSLAFDEQTGEAGIRTRLEAFLDLIRCRHWQVL